MGSVFNNARPAEVRRGCRFAAKHLSAAEIALNGGTITGSPTFSKDGIVLDGENDYATYQLQGWEFDAARVSVTIEFYPDLAADSGVTEVLLSCGSVDNAIFHRSNNTLRINLGGTTIQDIALATYQAHWFVGQRNLLEIDSDSFGATNVRLNNALILDADPTGWSPAPDAKLAIGATTTGASLFSGTIGEVKFYRDALLNAEDARAAYAEEPVGKYGLQAARPAEIRRGLRWYEPMISQMGVYANGGTVTGTPTFGPNGVTLNGTTDSITYQLQGWEFNAAEVSASFDLYPDFAPGDNTRYTICTPSGSGGIAITKFENSVSNVLRIYAGGSIIVDVAESVYSPHWLVGQRNTLLLALVSGASNVWLNGHQIVTNDSTSFTLSGIDFLYVGANTIGTALFKGTIGEFKIFRNCLLTEQEAIDYFNNDTWLYDQYEALNLPMRAAEHDPTNKKTLDISGHGNHAVFGDGSTSTTFPTKRAERGYDFDGGDYLRTAAGQIVDTGYLTMASLFRVDSGGIRTVFYYGESNTDIGGLIQHDDINDKIFFYCGGGTANNRAEISFPNPQGQLISCIGVYDGTNTSIYVNGVKGTDAIVPLPPDLDSGMSVYVGAFGNLSQYLIGSVLDAHMFTRALTPTQVHDLHQRMIKGIHNV